MSSGKDGSGSKDYYGHMAWELCQGQLDFTWGLMLNNEVAWPHARLWDRQTWQADKQVIFEGNAWKAGDNTKNDPPDAPWLLYALPWAAGMYSAGHRVLKGANVWQAAVDTATEPPDDRPDKVFDIKLEIWRFQVGDWLYISTPEAFADQPPNHWAANSIVAWKGRLWTTAVGTKAEPPDAPWVAWRVNRADSPNPLKFTVENVGDFYLYWGTADQVLDPVDEAILSALGHPSYRNRAVLVGKNILFGTMTTTPPDAVLLGGRSPSQTLIVGDAALMDDDWQVNPWCILAELMTHPVIGLGLPASSFDQASWQAEADRCAANPGLFYISPNYASLKKVREAVADILSYADSFIYWSNGATLMAGHWPHDEEAPAFTAENTVNRNELTEEISTTSDGWGGTSSSVEVSFEDQISGFKARPAPAPSLFNMSVMRRVSTERIDRPHIVREKQALAWAAEMIKIEQDQTLKGQELTVRAEKLAGLHPGSLFLLTDDVVGTSQVHRCLALTISSPPTGTRKLRHELERGISQLAYAPTEVNPVEAQGPPPAPILNAVFVQIPSALGTDIYEMICLAARSNDQTSTFDVWFRQADVEAFQRVTSQSAFAVAGLVSDDSDDRDATDLLAGVIEGDTYDLSSSDGWNFRVEHKTGAGAYSDAADGDDYNIVAGVLTVVAGGAITTGDDLRVTYATKVTVGISSDTPSSDVEALATSLTADEIADDKVLIFLFQADDPTKFEIMSLKSMTALGGDSYDFEVRRERFGTLSGGDGAHTWGENDVAFCAFREGLNIFTHERFPLATVLESTSTFILTPASAWVSAEVDDIYDAANNPTGLATEYVFQFENKYAPTVVWTDWLTDGAVTDFTDTFGTTNIFTLSFEVHDPDSNLIQASLLARNGTQEVTLWSAKPDSDETISKTVTFLLGEGTWALVMSMSYATNRIIEYPLLDSGDAEVSYDVQPPGGGMVAAPVIKWTKSGTNRITITCATAGATIHKITVPLYDPPGVYNVYTGPYHFTGNRTVYAYATHAGLTDSTVTKCNIKT